MFQGYNMNKKSFKKEMDMKRILYLIVLGLPMVVCAEKSEVKKQDVREYDMRKYNLDKAIAQWVNQVKKADEFDKMPLLIKDAWAQLEQKNYIVPRATLRKLSRAVFKYALTRPPKKNNSGAIKPIDPEKVQSREQKIRENHE